MRGTSRERTGAGWIMALTTEQVLARLASVMSADGRIALVETGRLSDIVITDGRVMLSIAIEAGEAARWEPVRAAAEAAIKGLPGVLGALVSLTAERAADATPARPGASAAASAASAGRPEVYPNLAKVRHVIAVASGKGGVGKSTTACNLALALTMLSGPAGRLKVGVLDADIYGPSMPKLFALKGQPRITSGRTLAPLEGYGCKVMSIGFLVDLSKAMIWRGPMVASAITQMLRDVEWGELDVLVVDMPPGTGDAQLTLAQQAPLAGAVIVSTPQDLALIDARRGVAMFKDVDVPILGLIENMSYFVCDECGKRHHIFAHGGAREESGRLAIPFLGEIPLELEIRERSDAGLPVVVTAPESTAAEAYRRIAAEVWAALDNRRK